MIMTPSVKADERYPALHDVYGNCDVLGIISVTSAKHLRHLAAEDIVRTATQYDNVMNQPVHTDTANMSTDGSSPRSTITARGTSQPRLGHGILQRLGVTFRFGS